MSGVKEYQPLRLMAGDKDDLDVFSTVLQDAVAKVGDLAYISAERRFVLVANRFVWECAGTRKKGQFLRVRAGVHFDDVMSVQFQHLKTEARDAVVELLALRFEPGADGGGAVRIDLAGGGAVRLEVESINAYLSDISDPWTTRSRPSHNA